MFANRPPSLASLGRFLGPEFSLPLNFLPQVAPMLALALARILTPFTSVLPSENSLTVRENSTSRAKGYASTVLVPGISFQIADPLIVVAYVSGSTTHYFIKLPLLTLLRLSTPGAMLETTPTMTQPPSLTLGSPRERSLVA